MDDRIVYVIDFSPIAKLHCHGLMCAHIHPVCYGFNTLIQGREFTG